MNKKGFTLIELIAALVIIALISTIVIINLDSVVNQTNSRKEADFKTDLEKAACVYIDLQANASYKNTCYSSGTCNVTVAQLISGGIITSDMEDPVTKQNISPSLVVTVTWNNLGVKTCTFNR